MRIKTKYICVEFVFSFASRNDDDHLN